MLQHYKVLNRHGGEVVSSGAVISGRRVLFIWEVCGLFLSLEGTNAHSLLVKVSPQQ
jgi:hypothetical protein